MSASLNLRVPINQFVNSTRNMSNLKYVTFVCLYVIIETDVLFSEN